MLPEEKPRVKPGPETLGSLLRATQRAGPRVSPEASSVEKQYSISWPSVRLGGTIPGRMVKIKLQKTRKERRGRSGEWGEHFPFLPPLILSLWVSRRSRPSSHDFLFYHLPFFKNDQSGSREDEYQKHLRNKPLTSLYLGNGRPPLSAPFSQLLRPPPPFTRTP